ncbi:DUF4476 domain-containing protein [Chitinophaga sp. XS-30]|uniref:DUF4476 domain-containing protein n=1 Tax=Chitinophaga sp. XS-30 TaxID=2604421 RepID=UPI0011DE26D5|nr:DUF4476 domain-containing protein [Chitinophaga sp. XS-30]QEH43782.1 DUF4476 domain-containing protein [Chitinophaga sp. XS-30]
MYRSKLKLLYLFCCLLVAGGLSAQDQAHFVYIQHEQQQPFYVKLNGKVVSSSSRGYVILSKLPQGKVPVTVGFLKNGMPEQEYTLRITGQRDYGYLLKNTGDKEFALYDLQTFATLNAAGGGAGVEAPQEEVVVTRLSDDTASEETKAMMDNVQADVQAALTRASGDTAPPPSGKKSSFAEALDKVVKDDRPDDMPLEFAQPKAAEPVPVVPAGGELTETVAVEQPAKKRNRRKERKERETLTEAEQALLSSVLEDEKQAAAAEALKEAPKEVALTDQEEAEPTPVKQKKVKKKKDQPEPEFIDFGEGGTAPAAAAKPPVMEEAVAVVDAAPEISAKEARDARRQKRKEEREAAERAAFVKDSIANSEYGVIPEAPEKKRVEMVNSDCPRVLETDAFRKLLRTMNSRKTDEDMVDAFRKGTRSVCVSTEQIRALAQLIATEENRYQLLDAAYPRTYDSQHFSSLVDLLKDGYYQRRFKAMITK